MKKDEKMKKVEAAIKDLRQGKMIIVVDDQEPENQGDLSIRRANTLFQETREY